MNHEGRSPSGASGERSTGDFRVDLATVIAEQLPTPGGEAHSPHGPDGEVSATAQAIVEILNLALLPAEAGPAVRQRFARFITRSAERVPRERRAAPAAHILGPVLEAIKYEPEDSPVDRMFSELLGRAFDGARAQEAHPSFPALIRQLSADEAHILDRVHRRSHSGTLVEQFTWHEAPADDSYDPWSSATWIRTNPYALAEPAKFRLYAEHLSQLGLASVGFDHQGPSPDYFNRKSEDRDFKYTVTALIKISLTLFGQSFVSAVGG